MFERFADETRLKVQRAVELAEREGAAMVEVEHLLLALVDPVTDGVGSTLESAGLTLQSVNAGRDREFRSALSLAGVTTARSVPAGSPRLRRGRTTRFAPSAKLALQRALEVALQRGDRSINNTHLLSAIHQAEVGIMPRLLDELGTNPEDLEQAVRDRS